MPLMEEKMKFEYVSVGFWTQDGEFHYGVMPDEVVKQIKTPQWMIDQLNESLYPPPTHRQK